MIKIIEHGYKKFKTECFRCGCKFEYETEDINDYKIECPDCGYKIEHYTEDFIINSKVKDS